MAVSISPTEALKRAVEKAGSQSGFARICGVGQPAVWKWLNRAKPLPAEHVLAVEAATRVSRHDLRPDLYPRELPAAGDDAAPADCGPVVSCDRAVPVTGATA